MHSYLVNASIQILPLAQDKHPYEWVDEAIAIIQASGLSYTVNAFSTEIEGSYSQVVNLYNAINEHLQKRTCHEWIANLQIQIRANEDMRGEEKTGKYKS